MIRRHTDNRCILIAQHDHAILAGELAKHVGNSRFAPPIPFEPVIAAIAQHDSGWPAHDQHPSLNAQGLARHVFESDVSDVSVLALWESSVDHAAAHGPYAGLLVSLHGLHLSAHAMSARKGFSDEANRGAMFKVNQFQQRQVERQEEFRRALGLRVDQPLRFGLAEPGRSPEEDLLLVNFHLMEALDRLSLVLCFDSLVFQKVEPVYPKFGADKITLNYSRDIQGIVHVDPWPFDVTDLSFRVPGRSISAEPFTADCQFQKAYAQATPEEILVGVRPLVSQPVVS